MDRNTRGVSLIEVIIGLLLFGMAVAALYGVSLSAFRTDINLEPYEEASNAVESLSEVLANYVLPNELPEAASLAPNGSLRLAEDPCPYALQTGCTHGATSFLSAALRQRFPQASLTYAVTQAAPEAPLEVEFTVSW